MRYNGIGPAAHLKEHGIEFIKVLPAAGSDLQDHLAVSVSYSIPIVESIVSLEVWPWVFIIHLIRYLIFGTSYFLTPILQFAIFANSNLFDDTGQPVQEIVEKPKTLLDIEIMPV